MLRGFPQSEHLFGAQAAIIGQSNIDAWFRTWEGTYLPTRELLKQIEALARTSPVTIINTSSSGSINTQPGLSAYQASKSALNRFTEFVHYEYPDSVRVFAYRPGSVPTQLSKLMPPGSRTPTDAPELAGGYALWLCSPEADLLRGRYSSANWDVDELVARRDEIQEKGLLFTVVKGQEPVRT
ncbi:hypothetical protein RQP46_003449 [Phenoliferia psychrophenolica]